MFMEVDTEMRELNVLQKDMEGSNYGVVRFGKDETRKQTCAISATHEILFLSESLSPSVYALLRADKGVI